MNFKPIIIAYATIVTRVSQVASVTAYRIASSSLIVEMVAVSSGVSALRANSLNSIGF